MAVLTKITSRSLADNAVTSSHVQADVIAAGDIAASAIGSSELADDAVGADQLASNAVVDASVASSAAIGLSKLATTGTLTATNIIGNPKATNATTLATTYSNEQEVVHGTTFTAGADCTVTGDVVLESLTDEAVTLTHSGTRTITGSGGRIIMKGLSNEDVMSKSGGGFTGPVTFNDHVQTKSIEFGGGASGILGAGITIGNAVQWSADRIVQFKFAQGKQLQNGSNSTFGGNAGQAITAPTLFITPTSHSNKIILIASVPTCFPNGNYVYLDFERHVLFNRTDNLSNAGNGAARVGNGSHTGYEQCTFMLIDEPLTTEEIEYRIQFRTNNNSTTVSIGDGGLVTAIFAMEIQV